MVSDGRSNAPVEPFSTPTTVPSAATAAVAQLPSLATGSADVDDSAPAVV
jgi:hypothetical protein